MQRVRIDDGQRFGQRAFAGQRQRFGDERGAASGMVLQQAAGGGDETVGPLRCTTGADLGGGVEDQLRRQALAGVDGSGSNDLYGECNAGCGCAVADFDPICSVEEDVTYISACFAGCSARAESSNTSSTFSDCACLPSGGPAVKGFCESARCDFTPFAALVFFQIFFTFAATMPGLVASLR